MKIDGFYKNTFRLALPVAVQNLLATCANMIDTAMVANLGNAEVAAVGICGRWMFIINIAIWGTCMGAASQLSQYWGAGEHENIRKTQCSAYYVCVSLSLLFTLATQFMPSQMIMLFNKEAEVVSAGTAYLRTVGIAAIPSGIATLCATARRSVEDVKVPMYVAVVAVMVNTFFNYVLIYGNFGAPRLGVFGAAIATAASLFLQAGLYFALGLCKKHFSITALSYVGRVGGDFFKKFVRICLPAGVNECVWGVGMGICSAVYARQGSENYAAYTIFSSIEQLALVFFQGMAAASGVMVGKAVGAGRIKYATALANKYMMLTPILGVVIGLAGAAVRVPILSLFRIETEGAKNTASTLLLIYFLMLGLTMIPYTGICGIFRAGGDTKAGIWLDAIGMYGFGIPAVLLTAYVFKAPFPVIVASAYAAEYGFKTPATLRHLRSHKWIIKLTQSGCVEE